MVCHYGLQGINSEKVLIHVRSVRRQAADQIRARATLRLGEPKPGDLVWFQGMDSVRRELNVVDIKKSSRLSTIVVSGTETDLEHLVGGTYLYGMDKER